MSKESPYGHKATDEMLSNAGRRRTTIVKPMKVGMVLAVQNIVAGSYEEAIETAYDALCSRYPPSLVQLEKSKFRVVAMAAKGCNGSYSVTVSL